MKFWERKFNDLMKKGLISQTDLQKYKAKGLITQKEITELNQKNAKREKVKKKMDKYFKRHAIE